LRAKIWYLYHSGFAVQTSDHFLIFDYWKQSPKGKGLDSGVINPAALSGKDVIVFVSHSHGDHFNRNILSWGAYIPKLRYVLSNDIRAVPGSIMIGPGQTRTQQDFTVAALKSNDAGVAFIIEIDGLCIYHAGDLNWWHWVGDTDEENAELAEIYMEQISLLGGRRIDLAFVPVDPRLGGQYAWGINYFMEHVDARCAVPMHFGNNSAVVERLLRDESSEPYRDKILRLTERGATAEI